MLTVCRNITDYLNRPDVRKKIGPDAAVEKFVIHNNDMTAAFATHDDGVHRSVDYVAALLERGVRVLVYVGANDWICNWVRALRRSLFPSSVRS